MNKTNPTVKALWHAFIAQHPAHADTPMPPHFYFCDNEADANTCADLVVKKSNKPLRLQCGGMITTSSLYQKLAICLS
ncbi:hypothetical protein N9O58_03590 [Flavobacteriaceae bacterium]|nr:hypothetical protein [Flavobacteriaceae bacterium]